MSAIFRIIVAACVAASGPSFAAELLGPARVIDGDTVEVQGTTVRILGIDAPELAQGCTDAGGAPTGCGLAASAHLAALIAGRDLLCQGTKSDMYGRLLARCDAGSGDVARQMVLDGMAIGFAKVSDDYAAEETLARKAGRGLWAGTFERPWEFRAAHWQAAAAEAPRKDCPIKGNISATGQHIYHMPHDAAYGRTRITAAKGERWFCDEAEAVREGWRAAR